MRNGKLKSKTRIKIEESCGNVFRDIGVENPELLLVKATLIVEIRRSMEERHLTATATGKLLGIAPIDVKALLQGDVEDHYTIRRLASILHLINESENDVKRTQVTANGIGKK
jgi:predicted XRE-type DNA-binding protein